MPGNISEWKGKEKPGMETHQQGECSQTGYHWAAGLNALSWSGDEKMPTDLTLCVPVITEKGSVNIKWYFKYHCCGSTAKSCLTLCNPTDCSTPGSSVSWSLLRLMSIESVILSNNLNPLLPLLLLPSICPSIRAFSNELALCMQKNLLWDLFGIFCKEKHFP